MTCIVACDVVDAAGGSAWSIEPVTDTAGHVATGGPIRFAFDRRLSPWSVDRNTVVLSSGTVGEFVFPWFDPLSNELVIELTRPLLPDTRYVLTLSGVEDLDGEILASPRQILFASSPVVTDLPEAPPPVRFQDVRDLLVTRCAGSDCHSTADRAGHLVLEDALGIAATARGKPSRQVSSVQAQGDAARGAGLVNLSVISDEGASSSVSFSYLIYKVLGDPHVLGEVMPPPATRAPLTSDELGLIARWIRTGAALE